MFTRIFVPLDGSARAERAVPVAALLARHTGGTVILARLVAFVVGYGPQFAPSVSPHALMEADLEAAKEYKEYLETVAKRGDLSGIRTETMAVEAVSVAPALVVLAGVAKADLIVICSHGRSGLTRWALGSVAQKVARQASVPTLVLHTDGPVPAGAHQDADRPLNVLVPLDGSKLAEAAIAPAAQLVAGLASPARGALHLLHVAEYGGTAARPTDDAVETRRGLLEAAKAYLRGVAERFGQEPLAALGLRVSWSVAFETDAAAAVLAAAEGGEDAEGAGAFGRCDLVAMATHGRSGFRLWALGSVTDRVLQSSKLPLLVVRPPQAEGQDESAIARMERSVMEDAAPWPPVF